MAKIIKVTSSTNTPRIATQFKTSRNSATNPFKYQNFEGNTLDISAFADVFESSAAKETNKMKLIASSIAGCVHKIKSGIAEPIVNFVNRVCEGAASAWNYAKNTNVSFKGAVKYVGNLMGARIEIPGLKTVDEFMHKPIEIPGMKSVKETVSDIKTGFGVFGENIVDLGKDVNAKWSEMISKIHHHNNKISSDMPVSELKKLWEDELSAMSGKEAA